MTAAPHQLARLQQAWDEEALARTAVRRARLAIAGRRHWQPRIAAALIAATALALVPGLSRAFAQTSTAAPDAAPSPLPVPVTTAEPARPGSFLSPPDSPAGPSSSSGNSSPPSVRVAPVETREARLRRDATRWEIAWQVLNAVDAAQTARCRARNTCTEANPGLAAIIGRRPAPGAVIAAKAGFGLVHWLLFAELRRRDPASARTAAQISVALQGGVVMVNFARGF